MKTAKVLIWHLIRKIKVFDCFAVCEATGCKLSQVQRYVKYLNGGGHLEFLMTDGKRSIYRVVNTQVFLPPNSDRKHGNDKLWSTMRIMKRFTIANLCESAEVNTDCAHRFVCLLLKSEIVKVAKANNSGTKGSYRLAKDLGVGTPIFLKDGRLLDSNTGEYLEVKL